MLSRRRRFASTSFKFNGKRFNLPNHDDDDDDENFVKTETNEHCNDENFVSAGLSTSTTETPTVQFENRWFALSGRYVGDDKESRNEEKSEKWTIRSTCDEKEREEGMDRSVDDEKGAEKHTDRSTRDGKTEKWTDRSTRDKIGAEKHMDRSTRDGKTEKWTDRSTRDKIGAEKHTDRSTRDGKTEKWTDRSTRDKIGAEKHTDRSTRDGKTEKWTDRSTRDKIGAEKHTDRSTRDKSGGEKHTDRSKRDGKTEKPTDRLTRDERGAEKCTAQFTRDKNEAEEPTDRSTRDFKTVKLTDRCTGGEKIIQRGCHVNDFHKNANRTLSMSRPSQASHRTTQRNAVNTMRRRRRKSPLCLLDSNEDDVFQVSSSLTNNRIIDDSYCSKVSDSFNKVVTTNHPPTDDLVLSSRINDHHNPSDYSDPLIYTKIPDNDKTISRTRRELYESITSLNCHRHVDDEFLTEHKSSRRRKFEEIPSCTTTMRKNHSLLSQWTFPKFRLIVVLGLLMWTTLMINGVAGRQNHHRTCPGCPHQHVHTINRKSGGNYDDEQLGTSGDTETSPSPDDLRLEAIKHQILTKLGLRTRPDVNRTLASVPRHLALETLYRAEAQPPGYSIENDDYHEGRRRDHHHRHLGNEDEDSLSLSSSSSQSSSSQSSSSSSSSSQSSSSSSSSSSSAAASSSSSYGKFYYDGEEYSYRNVDQGALEKDEKTKINENDDDSTIDGSYVDKDQHRGHRDDFDDETNKSHDYHHPNDNNNDDETQIEMDDFYARTSEIISFAEPGRTLNGQPLLEFPRSSGDPALEPLRIKRATLWARVELRHAHHYQHHRRAQNNHRNITLWVFRVRCGNVTHLRGKELGEHLEMVTSLGVKVNQLGWQKFDVTRVVSKWYSGHETASTRNEKLTLLVDCTGCGSHVHVSTFGVQSPHIVEPSLNANGGQDPDRPFLVVRTDPAAVKRVRRRAIECSGAIKGQCCKQRFYVSFSQLGWDDWIIAPQGYYANYCRGDCAAGHRTPDTFLNYYTHVIEEYRKMDRLAGMQPCCAPLKFSSMSLIYYGPDSNIIKRDLPKMVVDECGCP